MFIRFYRHSFIVVVICLFSVVAIVQYFQKLNHLKTVNFITDYQKSTIVRRARQLENNTQLYKWQLLGDPKRRHQIYSAYFDFRPEILAHYSFPENQIPYGSVRLFAILETQTRSQLYCNFVFTEEGHVETIEALEALPIHEHFDLPYAAFTIMCPLIYKEMVPVIELPAYVTISDNIDPATLDTPTYIPIRYGKVNFLDAPIQGLAICTGPIHRSYAQARRIVEYIHIYQLMGVNKFYFYNLTMTKHVSEVLQYFQNNQTGVEILNWNLHGYEFEKDIRYAGIFAAINDCVYRATFIDNFKYIAIVDLDEIIVNFKYNNLVEYLASIDDKNTESFVFRGVFFHENDEIASFEDGINAKNKFLYTQSRRVRTRKPLPVNIRSKYIVKGRAAIELGNHFVWRTINSEKQKQIDPSEGLLFHYRDDCLDFTCDTDKIVDTTLSRYGDKLRELVDNTCKAIFYNGACPID